MQVYLIRHPEPQVALGICYGQLDLPALDVDETADLLRQQLPAGLPLISSPLLRCRMLADALHPSPRFDDRLMEMNFGEWEGRHWDDMGREALNDWAADLLNHAPPGGESVTMLQARSVACLNALAAEGLPACIVVAHAGVMRSAVGHARGLPSTEWTQLKFGYGECVMLAWPAV